MALGEGAGAEEGDAVKESFTTPKRDGFFANKGEGLGLPSSSNLRLWQIRPTDSVS